MHHIRLRSALPAPPAYISYMYVYICDMYDLLTYMYTYTFEQRTADMHDLFIYMYTYTFEQRTVSALPAYISYMYMIY